MVVSKKALAAGFLALTSALGLWSSAARAGDDPSLFSFGAGLYDQRSINPGVIFLRVSSEDKKYEAGDFRFEYRFGKSLISAIEPYAKLKPWIGGEVTTDGAVYGVGGILFDVPLGPIMFTPSFGTGLYSGGGGKDLGSPIEFRSQVELGYQFDNQSRFSVGYSHISNAGITQQNPGSNIMSVYYHVPASWLLGQ
jgi:hypothetical protein